MTTRKITSPHLSRVEGHGGITLYIKDNKLSKVEVNITEGYRFFEPLVRTHKFDEVHYRTSRICAICSVSHTLASVRAVEDAIGYKPSDITKLFRHILHYGELIESNALHVFALALPDFLGYPSIIHMAKNHRDKVNKGLQIKKLGNTIMEVVGGRAIHPCTVITGGFSSFPDKSELTGIKEECMEYIDVLLDVSDWFGTLDIPSLEGDVPTFCALKPERGGFDFLGDTIVTSNGVEFSSGEYTKHISEEVKPYTTAKQVKLDGEPFNVGALARVSIFNRGLTETSKEVMEKLKIIENQHSMLYITHAQLVEIIYCLEILIELIDEALDRGYPQREIPDIKPKAGSGVGTVEAPRGLLIHEYEIDKDGMVVGANMIIPTTMNQLYMEEAIWKAIPPLIEDGARDDELKFKSEMIMRAFDPCISCSVHLMRL